MEKYIGKVAIVTGASTGIGAAIAKELATNGMIVVGLARRKDLVNKLNDGLPEKSKGKIYGLTCDVSIQEQIINAFSIVELNFGGCDVLINNAGILKETLILEEGNSEILTKTIATNLTGLIFCSKEAVSSMRKRDVNGHIIHIGSVAGHTVPVLPFVKPTMNVYSTTKFGVKALTETMRQELIYMKSKIKVSVISWHSFNIINQTK